jgi:hypothetical protein
MQRTISTGGMIRPSVLQWKLYILVYPRVLHVPPLPVFGDQQPTHGCDLLVN